MAKKSSVIERKGKLDQLSLSRDIFQSESESESRGTSHYGSGFSIRKGASSHDIESGSNFASSQGASSQNRNLIFKDKQRFSILNNLVAFTKEGFSQRASKLQAKGRKPSVQFKKQQWPSQAENTNNQHENLILDRRLSNSSKFNSQLQLPAELANQRDLLRQKIINKTPSGHFSISNLSGASGKSKQNSEQRDREKVNKEIFKDPQAVIKKQICKDFNRRKSMWATKKKTSTNFQNDESQSPKNMSALDDLPQIREESNSDLACHQCANEFDENQEQVNFIQSLDGRNRFSREIKVLRQRLDKNVQIRSLLQLIVIMLVYIDQEEEFQNKMKPDQSSLPLPHLINEIYMNNLQNPSTSSFIMRAFILIVNIPVMILTLFQSRHQLQLKQFIEYELIDSMKLNDKLYFVTEILICSIIPFPGVDFTFVVNQSGKACKYSYNTILTALQLLKLITLQYHGLKYMTRWTNQQADRICNFNGAKANAQFSFKALLTQRPFIMLSFYIMVCFLCFGFTIRCFERQVEGKENVLISDTLWIVGITVTTIGYGDFVPEQLFAKFLVFMVCIFGNSIQSLFVVHLQKQTNFHENESLVFNQLILNRYKRQMREKADKVIQNFLMHKILAKRSLHRKEAGIMYLNLLRSLEIHQKHRLQIQDVAVQEIDKQVSQMESLILSSKSELYMMLGRLTSGNKSRLGDDGADCRLLKPSLIDLNLHQKFEVATAPSALNQVFVLKLLVQREKVTDKINEVNLMAMKTHQLAKTIYDLDESEFKYLKDIKAGYNENALLREKEMLIQDALCHSQTMIDLQLDQNQERRNRLYQRQKDSITTERMMFSQLTFEKQSTVRQDSYLGIAKNDSSGQPSQKKRSSFPFPRESILSNYLEAKSFRQNDSVSETSSESTLRDQENNEHVQTYLNYVKPINSFNQSKELQHIFAVSGNSVIEAPTPYLWNASPRHPLEAKKETSDEKGKKLRIKHEKLSSFSSTSQDKQSNLQKELMASLGAVGSFKAPYGYFQELQNRKESNFSFHGVVEKDSYRQNQLMDSPTKHALIASTFKSKNTLKHDVKKLDFSKLESGQFYSPEIRNKQKEQPSPIKSSLFSDGNSGLIFSSTESRINPSKEVKERSSKKISSKERHSKDYFCQTNDKLLYSHSPQSHSSEDENQSREFQRPRLQSELIQEFEEVKEQSCIGSQQRNREGQVKVQVESIDNEQEMQQAPKRISTSDSYREQFQSVKVIEEESNRSDKSRNDRIRSIQIREDDKYLMNLSIAKEQEKQNLRTIQVNKVQSLRKKSTFYNKKTAVKQKHALKQQTKKKSPLLEEKLASLIQPHSLSPEQYKKSRSKPRKRADSILKTWRNKEPRRSRGRGEAMAHQNKIKNDKINSLLDWFEAKEMRKRDQRRSRRGSRARRKSRVQNSRLSKNRSTDKSDTSSQQEWQSQDSDDKQSYTQDDTNIQEEDSEDSVQHRFKKNEKTLVKGKKRDQMKEGKEMINWQKTQYELEKRKAKNRNLADIQRQNWKTSYDVLKDVKVPTKTQILPSKPSQFKRLDQNQDYDDTISSLSLKKSLKSLITQETLKILAKQTSIKIEDEIIRQLEKKQLEQRQNHSIIYQQQQFWMQQNELKQLQQQRTQQPHIQNANLNTHAQNKINAWGSAMSGDQSYISNNRFLDYQRFKKEVNNDPSKSSLNTQTLEHSNSSFRATRPLMSENKDESILMIPTQSEAVQSSASARKKVGFFNSNFKSKDSADAHQDTSRTLLPAKVRERSNQRNPKVSLIQNQERRQNQATSPTPSQDLFATFYTQTMNTPMEMELEAQRRRSSQIKKEKILQIIKEKRDKSERKEDRKVYKVESFKALYYNKQSK